MGSVYTTIVYDVEDYITPPPMMDDLLKLFADTMSEQKIPGNFFMIGEKLRSLRDRNRFDVLDSIARHDIGSHINMGSIHPTLAERLEMSDWSDGVARMVADELAGIQEMETIISKPISSLARHGGSFAPQLLMALSKIHAPYVYSPVNLPGHNVTWFCNTLNFHGDGFIFQEAYLSETAFQKRNQEFSDFLNNKGETDWVCLFHSHPHRIITTNFGCSNYYAGFNPNPDELKAPELKKEFSLDEIQRNFADHCRILKNDKRITLKNIADLKKIYGQQVDTVYSDEIISLAKQALDLKKPFYTARLSAGEIVDLFARAFVIIRKTGKMAASLERRDVLGPSTTPISIPTARKMNVEALYRLAMGLSLSVEMTGMLPSNVRCGEGTVGSIGEIGLGSAKIALAEAILKNSDALIVTPVTAPPYLISEGNIIRDEILNYQHWSVHKMDLDMSHIARLTSLQTWSLKPALP